MPKITGDIPNRSICAKVYRATYTQENVPEYTGAYDVTPKPEEQVLETEGKKMNDNVTVDGVAIRVVSNTAGGKTVIIGE